MSTVTQTYTKIDIQKVFANFDADLQMLAIRTQAMDLHHAQNCAHDVTLLAQEECLECVHIQLRDCNGRLVRAHRYSIKAGTLQDTQRPGANKWPCLPNGTLRLIISYSDAKKADQIERSGRLKISWGPTRLSTDYSDMKSDVGKFYSSNSYGLQRESFMS